MAHQIDATDISAYLAAHSDFDLEQYVHRTLLSHGIAAKHGGGYVDPLTAKYRQFDIRASKTWGDQTAIRAAIECKSLSKQFPLVVLRVPRPESESFHQLLISPIRQVEHIPIRVETVNHRHGSGPFKRGDPVGKSVTQIRRETNNRLTGNDSEAFDKWAQALASAQQLFEEANRAHAKKEVQITFVMPILVVPDETLWVVDYRESGEFSREPALVDEATLFVDRRYSMLLDGSRPFAPYIGHLHIFTKTGFTDWVTDISKPSGSRFWFMVFDSMLGEIIRQRLGERSRGA